MVCDGVGFFRVREGHARAPPLTYARANTYHRVLLSTRRYIIPEEMDDCRVHILSAVGKYSESKTGNPPIWIVKPTAGCQGDGIFLVESLQRLEDMMRTRLSLGDFVVQEYVKVRPLSLSVAVPLSLSLL